MKGDIFSIILEKVFDLLWFVAYIVNTSSVACPLIPGILWTAGIMGSRWAKRILPGGPTIINLEQRFEYEHIHRPDQEAIPYGKEVQRSCTRRYITGRRKELFKEVQSEQTGCTIGQTRM